MTLLMITYRAHALAFVAGLLLVNIPLLAEDQTPIIQEGTPIRMRINHPISSADATVGQTVDFAIVEDQEAGNGAQLPKGSTALGTVTEVRSKRLLGGTGKLVIELKYVRLPTGEKLPVYGLQGLDRAKKPGAMSSVGEFMKGKEITIPEGQVITVYAASDYRLGPGMIPPSVISATARRAKNPDGGFTNDDILKLKAAGVGDGVIVQKIRASADNFQLTTDDLLSLKHAGVSDELIAAMFNAMNP